MKKKILEERGSMAVYVTIVLLSFIIILSAIYATASSSRRNQLRTAMKIKESYEMYNNSRSQIYTAQKKKIKYPAGTVVDKPSDWTSKNVIPIADGNAGTVPLPSGFYYVGGDISTGLVISDKQGDTLDASGTSMGNQFVWIPVSSEADLQRTNFDANGKPTTDAPASGRNVADCEEPYSSGYATEASEYNTMKTQVLKYGGFYIGRFEAGVNSTTLRTKVTTNQTVVCKKGVAPYNYVPWGKAMDDVNTAFAPMDDNVNTNGAVYLAKNFASQHNYTSVTSTLTYGCQWDAMCRYIEDSQKTATTKSAVELTGSVATDVSKNIYDLAGNCQEWTIEKSTSRQWRTKRGGRYNNAFTINYRDYGNPKAGDRNVTFRPTVYIK